MKNKYLRVYRCPLTGRDLTAESCEACVSIRKDGEYCRTLRGSVKYEYKRWRDGR